MDQQQPVAGATKASFYPPQPAIWTSDSDAHIGDVRAANMEPLSRSVRLLEDPKRRIADSVLGPEDRIEGLNRRRATLRARARPSSALMAAWNSGQDRRTSSATSSMATARWSTGSAPHSGHRRSRPHDLRVSEVDRHWGCFAGVSWPGFASSLVGGGGCLVACVGPDQAVVPGIVSGILA